MPAGYSIIQASSYGVVCDGAKDTTAALQSALSALKPNQALELPAGTCVYNNVLSILNKTNAMVFGAGKDKTILQAKDPLKVSVVVTDSSNITLSGFQVTAPTASARNGISDSRGFYVQRASGVTLDGVKVNKVAGAGILFFIVTDSKIVNSTVTNSLADAFHITGDSKNILVQNNYSSGAGDDCFASIGYDQNYNYNVNFLDNTCYDNQASGVSYEGTIGGKAYRNKLVRTGVAGIRISSNGDFKTGKISNLDIRDNVLEQVRTRTEIGHAAIMVFTGVEDVDSVTFANNTITNGNTSTAAMLANYNPTVRTISNITFNNTKVTSTDGKMTKCFNVYTSGIKSLTLTGNTLNSTPCS